MDFHPFADTWPLLSEDELAKLAADIKANGQRLPIIVYQKKVLDGRNRYNACQKAGVAPRCEEAKAKNDHEALMLVVSLNEHRRHASIEQRAFAAEKIATLKNGLNKRYTTTATSNEVAALPEAAKLMGIPKTSAERARAVRTHAPELEQDVRDKKISLSAAADKAYAKGKAQQSNKSKPRESAAAARQRIFDARAALFKNNPPLTPEQVDPDFKGTGLEFVAKHGHVQLMSAADKEAQKRRLNITDWTGAVGQMAAIAKKILKLSDVDPTTWNATIAQRKLRLAENLTLIDQAMERIHANGLRKPNIKIVAS